MLESTSATAEDLDNLFQRGSGEVLVIQKTINPNYNFLRIKLNRKEIEISNDKASLISYHQSTKRGSIQGVIISGIVCSFLIWVHSVLFPADVTVLYWVLAAIMIAQMFTTLLIFFAFKFEENNFKPKRVVQIRKRDKLVEFTSSVSQRQLRIGSVFTDLKVAIPADTLSQELFITSLINEMSKNKQHLSRSERLRLVLMKLNKFPDSLAVDLVSENVKVIDQPIPMEIQDKFVSSAFLMFSFHEKAIIESMKSNLIQWAKF